MAGAGVAAGRIVALAVWVGSTANMLRVLLQAQAAPGRAARIGMVQLPVFALLLWFGISYFGLMGAALAVLARSLLDGFLLIVLSRIGGRALAGVLLPHAACLCVALAVAGTVSGLAWLVCATALLVAANLAVSVALSGELRGYLWHLWARAGWSRRGWPQGGPLQ